MSIWVYAVHTFLLYYVNPTFILCLFILCYSIIPMGAMLVLSACDWCYPQENNAFLPTSPTVEFHIDFNEITVLNMSSLTCFIMSKNCHPSVLAVNRWVSLIFMTWICSFPDFSWWSWLSRVVFQQLATQVDGFAFLYSMSALQKLLSFSH